MWESWAAESACPKAPGRSRIAASMTTMAASSPPLKT
jgi:hypothetical protein